LFRDGLLHRSGSSTLLRTSRRDAVRPDKHERSEKMADKQNAQRNEPRMPAPEEVARRAYELFQARGSEPGHDLENWFDAERELINGTSSEAPEEPRRSRADRVQ
jgi:hypothetical protein